MDCVTLPDLRNIRYKTLLFILLLFSNLAQAWEPSAQRRQQLLNLLKHDCGACHGLTLKGGLGPPLLPKALKNKSDQLLLTTILDGRKGTAMPPWKDFISKDEALWIITVLRHAK